MFGPESKRFGLAAFASKSRFGFGKRIPIRLRLRPPTFKSKFIQSHLQSYLRLAGLLARFFPLTIVYSNRPFSKLRPVKLRSAESNRTLHQNVGCPLAKIVKHRETSDVHFKSAHPQGFSLFSRIPLTLDIRKLRTVRTHRLGR